MSVNTATAATAAMFVTTTAAAVLLSLLLLLPLGVAAHPNYRDAIPNGHRVERAGVAWPGVGHLVAEGGGGARNTFGLAFAAEGHTWTSTLCNADTDGDGFSNGAELGDPGCTWTVGSVPERSVGISHPGYADSAPLITTPSYRLVGPSAYEGVLQARIYPRAWGAVNFHSIDTEWSREYCRALYLYNQSDFTRAWVMENRPVADQQYLPDAHYVSISDVSGCGDVDMASCAFQYSDVGSPQNTTDAVTSAIYVDCRYNAKWGIHEEYMPVRLTGPVPGRGELQVYLKDSTPNWVNFRSRRSPWLDPSPTTCGTLLGYDTDAFTPTYEQGSGGANTREMPVGMVPFMSPDALWNSTFESFEYIPIGDRPYRHGFQKYVCDATAYPTSASGGKAVFELVANIEAGHTPASFAALVAATYPGVNAADVATRYWNDTAVFANSYVAVRIKSTVASSVNPSTTIQAMATTDAATFGIVGAEISHHDDPEAPTGMPEFSIDGPTAAKGVLKARYGADAWGHVHWHKSIPNAKSLCGLAGVSTTGYIPDMQYVADEPLSASYMVPDSYMSISDPGACLDDTDVSTCPFVHSPPGVHRNATNVTSGAIWIDCHWSSYPDVRLTWHMPCYGVIEARMPGTTEWLPAWTDMTPTNICELAGCPCIDANCYFVKPYKHRKVELFLHTCDLWGDRSACAITNHNPSITYNDQQYVMCRHPNDFYSVTTVTNQLKARTKLFVLNSSMTPALLPAYLDSMYNISAEDVVIHSSNVNETTGLSHFHAQINNENPQTNPFDQPTGLAWSDYGFEATTQAELFNNKLIYSDSYAYDPRPYEWRLHGISSTRGYVQVRALNGMNKDWGYIHFNHHNFGKTDWGDRICKSAGEYRENKVSMLWRVTGAGGVAVDSLENADAAPYAPGAVCRAALFDWGGCSDELMDNCTHAYNDKSHSGACEYSPMVDCAFEPFPMRLAGSFPGIGRWELKFGGVWHRVSHNDPPNHCKKWFNYPENPAWTPIRTLEPTAKYGNVFTMSACPDPTEYPKCVVHMKGSGGNTNDYVLNCVEPPSTLPFAGASITQLNAAITFGPVDAATFRLMAAEIAGVALDEIIISQWNNQPSLELSHLTISINNSGINAGVALGNIAANTSIPWLHSDVRQMPLPTGVPATSWDWGMELLASGSKRGFVVARPTSHFQYGVPCGAKWTVALTRTFCATMFGAGVLTWPRDPTFEQMELPNGGVRNMYLEDVLCPGAATDIKTCSYGFAPMPTATCPGTANILVDCQPVTGTATTTATETVSASLTASVTPTSSVSRSGATLSRSRSAATPSVSGSALTPSPSLSVSPSASRSVPPTASRQATRTPDQPTPAPPTPAPPRTVTHPHTRSVSLTVQPTPAPPPPPPSWGVHAFVVGGAPALAVRPGARVRVGVTLELLHATPTTNANATAAASTVFVHIRGTGLVLPSSGVAGCVEPLPAACVANPIGVDVDVTCSVAAASSGLTRWSGHIDLAAPVPALAAANATASSDDDGVALSTISAQLSVGDWASGFAEAAQYAAVPTGSARVAVPVQAGVPRVAGALPALNALAFGSGVALWGSGLRSLPVALAFGPWLATVEASADGRTAAVHPLAAWASAGAGSAAAVSSALDAVAAVSSAAGTRSALAAHHAHEPRRRHLACHVLSDASVAAIAAGAAEWASGPPTEPAATALLRRFDVALATAQVSLSPPPAARPAVPLPVGAITVTPPPSAAPGTVPTGPAAPPPPEEQPTALAAWVATCNVSEGSTGEVRFAAGSSNATTYYAAALVATDAVAAPAASHATANTSTTANTSIATAAECRGTWAVFEFPPTLTQAIHRVANADPNATDDDGTGSPLMVVSRSPAAAASTDNNSSGSSDSSTGDVITVRPVGPGTVTLVVTVRDPARLTVSEDTRTYVVPAMAASVASSGRYRVRVRVWAARAAAVRGVVALAYSDAELSLRPYVVQAMPVASGCSDDARNQSTACTRAVLEPQASSSASAAVAMGSRRQSSDATPNTTNTSSLQSGNATSTPFANSTKNMTTNATDAGQHGDGVWEFELAATGVPAYFTGRVVAWLHVRSANAPAFALAVALTPDNTTAAALPAAFAGGSGNASSPAGGFADPMLAPLTPAPPPGAPGSPATVAPVAGPAATPAPPALGQAVVRGIFGYSAGCDGTRVNFLAATLLAFALLLLGRLVATAVLRRRGGPDDEDRHRTSDAAALPALLRVHVYAGALVPCHHYCGAAHAVQLLAHALSLYAVAAAFVNAYPELASDARGVFALGGLTALVAALGQPIVGLPFTLYRTVDRRREPLPSRAPYVPHDMAKYGGAAGELRRGVVGVHEATLSALGDVGFDAAAEGTPAAAKVSDIAEADAWTFDPGVGAYDDDHDHDDHANHNHSNTSGDDDEAAATSPPGATIRPSSVNPNASIDASSPRWAALVPPTTPRQQSGPLKPPDTTTTTTMTDSAGTDRPDTPSSRPTPVDSSLTGTAMASMAPPQQRRTCARRDPQTCVVVDARTFTAVGFGFAGVLSAALATTVAAATAAWCEAEIALFRDVMLVAACVDAAGVQGLLMAGTAAWRWLTSDDGETADDDDDDSDSDRDGIEAPPRTVHELHPIHGQWRQVGALESLADMVEGMAAEEATRPAKVPA